MGAWGLRRWRTQGLTQGAGAWGDFVSWATIGSSKISHVVPLKVCYGIAEEFSGSAFYWPPGASFSTTGHVGYSLNSLKGGYIGDYVGDCYRRS